MTAKTLIRLGGCPGWSESSLGVQDIWLVLPWCSSVYVIFPCWTFLPVQIRKFHLSHLVTKPTQWHVHPAKTQISLGIRPVWSESSLCAQWVAEGPSFLHRDSEDSDQTGRMPRLIWVFDGRTRTLLVLSRGGSFVIMISTLKQFDVILLLLYSFVRPSFLAFATLLDGGDKTILCDLCLCLSKSRWKDNDQEPIQLNSKYYPRHHMGKEHRQSRRHKENTAQAESQEVSSFPADVHQAILDIINK